MRTNDITKSYIDRNFLRTCIKHGIIRPQKADNENIIDKSYVPYEYSQKDKEIVWNAYLYRQMGLSYSQISELNRGKHIPIRDTVGTLIDQYQEKIDQLLLIIEFMQYVKGVGFFPSPPEELMGSDTFTDYLKDFIKYIDENQEIKKTLSLARILIKTDEEQDISDEELSFMEKTLNELYPYMIPEDLIRLNNLFQQLKDISHTSPASPEVQDILLQFFYYLRVINKNNISPCEIADYFLDILRYDSDLSVMFKKLMGQENVGFFTDAFTEFMKQNKKSTPNKNN